MGTSTTTLHGRTVSSKGTTKGTTHQKKAGMHARSPLPAQATKDAWQHKGQAKGQG